MAYTSSADKSFFGTPGLLYRQRLEYGLGGRGLKGKRDLLVSMHSNQRSMSPVEEKKPDECRFTLPELLQTNDEELDKLVVVERHEGEQGVPIAPEDQERYTLLLEACLKRLDEINWRAKILENIRPAQGPPLP